MAEVCELKGVVCCKLAGLHHPHIVTTVHHMKIEFDPAKNEANILNRGLPFDWVVKFEFETAIIWIDSRKPYPEVRMSALGRLAGRVYSVVFTETATGIRVISFRKANKREVARYEQETKS